MPNNLFYTDENLLPANGTVQFYPQFFTKAESDIYLQHLLTQISWKQEPIKIFGKEVMQPRLTAWYGNADKPYTYSGITMQPNLWTDILTAIKTKIETAANTQFTSALLNLYRNGQDSMGWHRDNETALGINPVIASVSFGASRMFQLRDYTSKKSLQSIELTHGSLLLMGGVTQHYWEHRIPKTSKPVGNRINLTFRKIL
jgi:alkylated DNA repair dioxygenase AlkB